MNFKQKAKMFTDAVNDTRNIEFGQRNLILIYLAKGMACMSYFDADGFELHSLKSGRIIVKCASKI
jgi:hypothetical protein